MQNSLLCKFAELLCEGTWYYEDFSIYNFGYSMDSYIRDFLIDTIPFIDRLPVHTRFSSSLTLQNSYDSITLTLTLSHCIQKNSWDP